MPEIGMIELFELVVVERHNRGVRLHLIDLISFSTSAPEVSSF
jgi:hypothetical protein